MTSIRELLIQAMADADLNQSQLGRRARINQGQISLILDGRKGLSLASLDRWVEACGVRLLMVKQDTAVPEDVLTVPLEKRDLVLRLARILPRLDDTRLEDFADQLAGWERRYGSSPERLDNDSPSNHDSRAKSS